ncbi:hypothetical protein [Helicobacter sp. MIT 01-3238]|uniref:hypothetical protein n=1 Tax=Helicobacter sp. MIT 01-3238 TaxID=398627 RepID=UPI000E1E85A3|nr:hypothetical protein [Helicobacter sp. MIT 01-3238]RDU55144.1 hypothetical protein CQA40_01570 [Helicobacter sp. MIT 01-3238]
MKLFLKILLASLIAMCWNWIAPNSSDVTITLFIFVLAVLMMNPVKFQSPEKREEYIQKIREKKEQKLAIARKQQEEKARLRNEKFEREEREKKELQAKVKSNRGF